MSVVERAIAKIKAEICWIFDLVSPLEGFVATPNPAYFQRVDEILNIAAAHGVTILLDAAETDGYVATLKANGVENAAAFGQYLGNRYKRFPNIIWMYGNDFQNARYYQSLSAILGWMCHDPGDEPTASPLHIF